MKQKIVLFVLFLSSFFSKAQENLNYQLPPKSILDLAEYDRSPSVSMDTKKIYMLLSYRSTYKTLDDLNQEELRLAGIRINPLTNISSSTTYISNLKLKKITDKSEVQVTGLPQNAKIANLQWSPNETKISFTITTTKGVQLWILDVATAAAKPISQDNLNANLGSPYIWLSDNKTLLVKNLPSNRSKLIDSKKDLPTGPIVSNASGTKSQNRTYPDMLKNKTDETNFENVITSELFKITIDGNVTFFKNADMYAGQSLSPDGSMIMITTIQKPFSYIVPLNRFPSTTNIYDQNGNLIRKVNETPLTEIIPKGFMAVQKGKRQMAWRNDEPSTLYFVEALDGGDPANTVDFRDEIFTWKAPFADNPTSILKLKQRFSNMIWGNNTLAIVQEEWYDTRNEKTFLINPSNQLAQPKLLFDRNSQDIYGNPGTFETKKNQYNKYVLNIENDKGFLIGEGFTKDGQFPFITEYNFKTLQSKRIYTSTLKDKKEDLFSIEDTKKGIVLVQIQSKSDFPNYFFRNIKTNVLTPITDFKNPFESIKNVYKEVIKYKRSDGVDLSGTLYLPADYDRTKKEKLPLLIWAYPAEYKDKNSAGQSSQNPNEFTFPYYGSFVYWVTRGYAVLDDAAFPIIGEGTTEPNDTFIKQLTENAEAAIKAVNDLGYINDKKVAVGGHSYGAFMTANLLTHTKLFACGIARSGAYNRTLTPFGFQSEQRNYWESPTVYNEMSPFMNAEKMKTPLLLVHGEADNNPGTFTLQTERYFQALKGLGAPVRMLILPKEQHGYAAKENIFHLLWEQDKFLEKYLKG
jgi:dipeptidyl aminopeptidase/acylaminoacyl peptidase